MANLAFRQGRLPYSGIYDVITTTLGRVAHIAEPEYADYVATNDEACAIAAALVDKY